MARRVRVAVSPLVVGEAELDAAQSRYLTRVHRLREGDRFVAFDPEAGTHADGEIIASESRRVRCRFESLRESPTSTLAVTLLQSLGKGDKPDRVIRDATALGASAVILVESERSVPKPGERRAERWASIAVDAARQSGRGDIPEIAGPLALADALAKVAACELGVVLDPLAEASFAEVLASRARGAPLALLIGPEGGLSPAEIAVAERAGFVRARFGAFTLRTETAATAVLGALVALRELG